MLLLVFVWLTYFLLTYFTIQLIFLLFMGSTALLNTIHRSHYTISTSVYLYLQYFQQKVFSFSKISRSQTNPKCAFGSKLKNQFILLFSLFLLLFMDLTALFGIIHGSHCTISAIFYFYLQYFQQKVFNFSKISRSQTDPKLTHKQTTVAQDHPTT